MAEVRSEVSRPEPTSASEVEGSELSRMRSDYRSRRHTRKDRSRREKHRSRHHRERSRSRSSSRSHELQNTIADERLQNLEEKLAQLTRQEPPAAGPQSTNAEERLRNLEERIQQLTQPGPQVVEPQPTVIRVSINSDRIPEFIPGQTNQSPAKWVDKIDQLAHINRWDKKTTIRLMRNRLAGLARTWYNNLTTYAQT
jgi:hypothetical protein